MTKILLYKNSTSLNKISNIKDGQKSKRGKKNPQQSQELKMELRGKARTSIACIQRWVNQLPSARREYNTGQSLYHDTAIKTKLLSLYNDSKSRPPGYGFHVNTNA